MSTQNSYRQLVFNLAKLTVDLAIEVSFHPELPPLEQLEKNKSFETRLQQFQPAISQLEKSLSENQESQKAAESLSLILDTLRTFLEKRSRLPEISYRPRNRKKPR
jgi:hypothetical protein